MRFETSVFTCALGAHVDLRKTFTCATAMADIAEFSGDFARCVIVSGCSSGSSIEMSILESKINYFNFEISVIVSYRLEGHPAFFLVFSPQG